MQDKSYYPASEAFMTLSLAEVNPSSVLAVVPHQAETDQQLIDLWVQGRSPHTQRAYRADAERFLQFAGVSLPQVTLGLIQMYADSLAEAGLAPATIHRTMSAVKSIFAFGHRLGYLQFDVARPLRLSAVRDTLNERILDESEVQKILAMERHPRNAAILRLLYVAGLRVSELCSLKWKDLRARNEGGQVTVMGKRGKTRSILVPEKTWMILTALRDGAAEDAPVFQSRRRGPLHPSQILRIVKAAAKKAGIAKEISPHWFRHAHASHALDRQAPISLVQATLGHADVSSTGRYLHARPSDSSSRYLPV
jgi:integrase/recombinase XerD